MITVSHKALENVWDVYEDRYETGAGPRNINAGDRVIYRDFDGEYAICDVAKDLGLIPSTCANCDGEEVTKEYAAYALRVRIATADYFRDFIVGFSRSDMSCGDELFEFCPGADCDGEPWVYGNSDMLRLV